MDCYHVRVHGSAAVQLGAGQSRDLHVSRACSSTLEYGIAKHRIEPNPNASRIYVYRLRNDNYVGCRSRVCIKSYTCMPWRIYTSVNMNRKKINSVTRARWCEKKHRCNRPCFFAVEFFSTIRLFSRARDRAIE